MNEHPISSFPFRTDLAMEAGERFIHDNVEINGVILEEHYDKKREVTITKVVITSEKGARAMGKPRGTYITLEAPNLSVPDEDYHREISSRFAKIISDLSPCKNTDTPSVLVVGLGNRQVTADALGPQVVDHLTITRHLLEEYGTAAMDTAHACKISSIVPGVMGQTGMETLEILQGIVSKTKPDYIIAIDALAARSAKRLNRTIQIANTGIHPGSGVGNHRSLLSKESLGVPVIAVGVPTVVEATTIVQDANGDASSAPHLNGMYVTPKDIDEAVDRMAHTISEGLNMALLQSK